MDYATRDALLLVLMVVLMAAVMLPVLRRLLHIAREAIERSRVTATGTRGTGMVLEVTLVDEGSEGDTYRIGGLLPVVQYRDGRRAGGPLRPRYRVLLRHTPPGQEAVVADTEQELAPGQLDVLVPDAEVPIRYDPAQPERVALDPEGLRALVRRGAARDG